MSSFWFAFLPVVLNILLFAGAIGVLVLMVRIFQYIKKIHAGLSRMYPEYFIDR